MAERKVKSERRRRSIIFSVRLTPEELDKLRGLADESDCSVGDYIRSRALRPKLRVSNEPLPSNHDAVDHQISGSPYEQMRAVMARHLCGWIGGHGAPLDHFLVDADMILAEAHAQGLRFHFAGPTENMLDGFIYTELVSG